MKYLLAGFIALGLLPGLAGCGKSSPSSSDAPASLPGSTAAAEAAASSAHPSASVPAANKGTGPAEGAGAIGGVTTK